MGLIPVVKSSEGYNYLEENHAEFLCCSICHNPFVDPILTVLCQHQFCNACIQEHLTKASNCPTCRGALNKELCRKDEHPILRRNLDELKIYCSNKEHGCEWIGERGNLTAHLLQSCAHFPCPLKPCQWRGPQKLLPVHFRKECTAVPHTCPLQARGCAWQGPKSALESHKLECPVVRARLQVIEQQRELEEQQRRELIALCANSNPPYGEMIALSVAGQRFEASRRVLTRYPNSVLAAMFSEAYELQKNDRNEVVLDVAPNAFEHLLRWLRSGVPPLELSRQDRADLLQLCQTWRLGELARLLPADEPTQDAQGRPRISQRQLLKFLNTSNGKVILPFANLDGLQMSGFQLANIQLAGSSLRGADLSNASLPAADLRGVDLTNANLAGCNLTAVNLIGANCSGANFTQANIAHCNFESATLTNAILTNAVARGAAAAASAKTNFSGCNLTGSNLAGVQLEASNLTRANLTNAILPPNLRGVSLVGCDLTGHNVNELRGRGAQI